MWLEAFGMLGCGLMVDTHCAPAGLLYDISTRMVPVMQLLTILMTSCKGNSTLHAAVKLWLQRHETVLTAAFSSLLSRTCRLPVLELTETAFALLASASSLREAGSPTSSAMSSSSNMVRVVALLPPPPRG